MTIKVCVHANPVQKKTTISRSPSLARSLAPRSAAGTQNMPLLAQYSAAKSYVCYLSRGLSAELSSKNITVQTQVPFYVATKLAKLRKSFTVPTPDA